ncbi:hypothetical protein HZP35_18710 [Elizabethkingia anophelis]|nr:hypothetical protein [Elizabethkingia anophelis]MCT4085478.1 hypothetical protein [Elizabethkingia anophelis]MCT4156972.1 hypothetical protein [Elizabethkingia anophelis]MCT4171294.1 hypothetical protein [Elizabethkingia anophelis]MCT4245709.1 hypothetical protein [Elizabethkingia anophelis]
MKSLTYPHYTVAPVIETVFVDGFQFEICEFNTESARKEFGISKVSRFFLMIEGNYFNNESLEKGGSLIGDDIWSTYCKDRQFINNLILDFEQKLEAIEKWQERASRIKEGNYNSFQITANKLKADIKNRYSVHLK